MKRIILAAFCAASLCPPSFAGSKTALVKDGELWAGKDRLTGTGGKIDGFAVSASGRYASAHKVVGRIEEHDDSLEEDREPVMTPVYSILIVDLTGKRPVHELTVFEAELLGADPGWKRQLEKRGYSANLLHLGQWRKDDRYRFSIGSQLDVIGEFEYDPAAGNLRKLTYDDEAPEYR